MNKKNKFSNCTEFSWAGEEQAPVEEFIKWAKKYPKNKFFELIEQDDICVYISAPTKKIAVEFMDPEDENDMGCGYTRKTLNKILVEVK